jgi:hypothetical protein
MAITPEVLNEVQQAYRAAVDSINIEGQPPVFYDTQVNADVVRKYLLSQTTVPMMAWKSDFVWKAAILECRAQNRLVPLPVKKSREERERELHLQDRAAGNALKSLTHTRPEDKPRHTPEETVAANKAYEDALNPGQVVARKVAAKADAEVAAANEQRRLLALFPDVSQEFADYSPEQHAAFRKLTPANMRFIGARRDDWKRGKSQEAAAARGAAKRGKQ